MQEKMGNVESEKRESLTIVAPMISQSQILQRQIQNLRRTRDLQLPRLLSGQVELKLEAA
jgi:type I restriction enzyme S subunit